MKINTYTKKDGSTVYRASVFLGVDKVTGKKVKTTVSARTKRELEQKARRKVLDFEKAGSTVHKAVAVKTYQELAELWLESYQHTVKPQSYYSTEKLLRKRLLPYFGAIKLDKITVSLVQSFINRLAGEVINFHAIHSINKRILQHGVLLQAIKQNPAREIILPRAKKSKRETVKFIDQGDLKSLIGHMERLANQHYRHFFDYVLYSFLLATGCRFGEVAALNWSDIDLEGLTVSIDKTYNKALHIISTAKTKSAKRLISIDPKTANLIKLYKVRQAQIFREAGLDCPQVVFSTPTREYMSITIRQEALTRRCRDIAIPRFTFHAFRHTHASLLLNAGISYKELQYRLGHAKINMTLDVYGHLSLDKEKEAVTYFEKAMSAL